MVEQKRNVIWKSPVPGLTGTVYQRLRSRKMDTKQENRGRKRTSEANPSQKDRH